MRLMGICWGHQAIAQALGGEVQANERGWELGVYDIELNEEGEEVWGYTKWDEEDERGGGALQEVRDGDEADDGIKRMVSARCRAEGYTRIADILHALYVFSSPPTLSPAVAHDCVARIDRDALRDCSLSLAIVFTRRGIARCRSRFHAQRLQQVHKDHVTALPDPVGSTSFTNLGSTPLCENHSLCLKYPTDSPPLPSIAGTSQFVAFDTFTPPTSSGPSPPRACQILTLQGHPEFDSTIVGLLIDAKTEMGSVDDAHKDEARRRAVREDDALKVGQRLLCMLGVEIGREEGGDAMGA